jgi:hypothetical protein
MAIQSQVIALDRGEARELYRRYKAHVHYAKPIDREIQRTYQLIAQGRVVIRALESIKAAGLNEQGLPKLAIVRADFKACWCDVLTDGRVRFGVAQSAWHRNRGREIELPAGSLPNRARWVRGCAMAPIIPVHMRPKRGLQNYHVLWEAEWSPVPPGDPLLLRRIGRGDLWLVTAAWDLTEVEKAALATRLNS